MEQQENTGVTIEPQGPEQTSLDSFKASPEATIAAYITVSDDNGVILGNMEMEAIAQNYCQMLEKEISTEEAKEIISKGMVFCQEYYWQINFADNTVNGIVTKYRLRWGMMLLLQKKALKQLSRSNRWEEWFTKNYPVEQSRSAQDYMRLARIPNIIAFAVLGKERLMALSRLLEAEFGKDFSGAEDQGDPLGSYLKQVNIGFDFSKSGTQDDEVLAHIDLLYLKKRMKDFATAKGYEIDNLSISDEILLDVVKIFSKPLSNKHFNDMLMIKEAGGDVETHIKSTLLLLSSGTTTPPDVRFRSQANRLEGILSLFTDILEYLEENHSATSVLSMDTIEAIESKIQSLKAEISNASQTTDEATVKETEEVVENAEDEKSAAA